MYYGFNTIYLSRDDDFDYPGWNIRQPNASSSDGTAFSSVVLGLRVLDTCMVSSKDSN